MNRNYEDTYPLDLRTNFRSRPKYPSVQQQLNAISMRLTRVESKLCAYLKHIGFDPLEGAREEPRNDR